MWVAPSGAGDRPCADPPPPRRPALWRLDVFLSARGAAAGLGFADDLGDAAGLRRRLGGGGDRPEHLLAGRRREAVPRGPSGGHGVEGGGELGGLLEVLDAVHDRPPAVGP